MKKHRELEERVAEALFPSMEASRREGWTKLFQDLYREWKKAPLPPSPIHGDLSAAHLLVEKHHLTGVIDWSDASIGDPAHDFAALWLEFGERITRRVAQRYSGFIDSAFWLRADLYRRLAPLYRELHHREPGDEKV